MTVEPMATSSNVIGAENLALVSANPPDSAVACVASVVAVRADGDPGTGVTIGALAVIGAVVPEATSLDDVCAAAG